MTKDLELKFNLDIIRKANGNKQKIIMEKRNGLKVLGTVLQRLPAEGIFPLSGSKIFVQNSLFS